MRASSWSILPSTVRRPRWAASKRRTASSSSGVSVGSRATTWLAARLSYSSIGRSSASSDGRRSASTRRRRRRARPAPAVAGAVTARRRRCRAGRRGRAATGEPQRLAEPIADGARPGALTHRHVRRTIAPGAATRGADDGVQPPLDLGPDRIVGGVGGHRSISRRSGRRRRRPGSPGRWPARAGSSSGTAARRPAWAAAGRRGSPRRRARPRPRLVFVLGRDEAVLEDPVEVGLDVVGREQLLVLVLLLLAGAPLGARRRCLVGLVLVLFLVLLVGDVASSSSSSSRRRRPPRRRAPRRPARPLPRRRRPRPRRALLRPARS